jgi:3-dehydroquinate synthase
MEVKSSNFSYQIKSDDHYLRALKNRRVIIFDSKVKKHCLELFPNEAICIEIEILEEKKNLDSLKNILTSMAKSGVNRNDHIIAVGGGALQDLVTLAASIYMRGIEWHFVPTTLMSMLDSCIGGKSSINVGPYKNLVGNFYPPRTILINPTFLSTLSNVEIASGLAEGLKICFARSKENSVRFEKFTSEWRASKDTQLILSAIFLSLESKKWFVEIDEFDKKERRLLNFGHSFGHALESATNYSVPHGIGVFIGMYAAVHRSDQFEACATLSRYIENEIRNIVRTFPKIQIDKEKFQDAMKRDKKNSDKLQILILPDASGGLVESKFEITSMNLDLCFSSLIFALDKLGFRHEIL